MYFSKKDLLVLKASLNIQGNDLDCYFDLLDELSKKFSNDIGKHVNKYHRENNHIIPKQVYPYYRFGNFDFNPLKLYLYQGTEQSKFPLDLYKFVQILRIGMILDRVQQHKAETRSEDKFTSKVNDLFSNDQYLSTLFEFELAFSLIEAKLGKIIFCNDTPDIMVDIDKYHLLVEAKYLGASKAHQTMSLVPLSILQKRTDPKNKSEIKGIKVNFKNSFGGNNERPTSEAKKIAESILKISNKETYIQDQENVTISTTDNQSGILLCYGEETFLTDIKKRVISAITEKCDKFKKLEEGRRFKDTDKRIIALDVTTLFPYVPEDKEYQYRVVKKAYENDLENFEPEVIKQVMELLNKMGNLSLVLLFLPVEFEINEITLSKKTKIAVIGKKKYVVVTDYISLSLAIKTMLEI